MRFIIKGRLDGLNEYTKSCRGNKYGGNSMKQSNERIALLSIIKARIPKVKKYPVQLKITWYEPNRRRDIDNITFATKFIQDALVSAGILKNDSQKYINKIYHDVKVDKNNPRIEVEIIEGVEC